MFVIEKKWNRLIKILLPDIGHCLLSLYLTELLEKESIFNLFLCQIKLNSVNFNNMVLIRMLFYCCIIMAPTVWWLMWSQLSISVTIQITRQQISLGIWTDTVNYKKLNKVLSDYYIHTGLEPDFKLNNIPLESICLLLYIPCSELFQILEWSIYVQLIYSKF